MKQLMNKTLLTNTLIFVSLLLVVLAQIRYDQKDKPFIVKFEAVNRTLTPAIVLQYTNFGFSNVIADYYWINAIQDVVQWNEKDHFYVEYFKNISTLDPKFEYPYLLGIFVVPNEKSPKYIDEIASVADVGISALPDNWRIPFYLSTAYKMNTKNLESTDHYLSIAASIKDAPEAVQIVYKAFSKNKLKTETFAREMIKVIYDTTDNETIKKLAAKGLLINDIRSMLEKAIATFKLTYNVFPENIHGLEELNYIALPQEVKDAFTVVINTDGTFKLVEKITEN